MGTGRLEAFSDGVIAILITIMVLELRIPHGSHVAAVRPLVPVFSTYALSFVNLGIYWNNHHHMLQMTPRINGKILWANLHLLFWLSLLPFFTGWMGENHFATLPTAAYGGVLLLAAIAYFVLQTAIVAEQGPGSTLAAALGRDTRQDLPGGLHRRHSPRLRQPVGRCRALRRRRRHVAGARPAARVNLRSGLVPEGARQDQRRVRREAHAATMWKWDVGGGRWRPWRRPSWSPAPVAGRTGTPVRPRVRPGPSGRGAAPSPPPPGRSGT